MPDIIRRFGQQSTAITAAVLNLLQIFHVVDWTGDQVAAVNTIAILVWSVLFGDAVRALNAARDA